MATLVKICLKWVQTKLNNDRAQKYKTRAYTQRSKESDCYNHKGNNKMTWWVQISAINVWYVLRLCFTFLSRRVYRLHGIYYICEEILFAHCTWLTVWNINILCVCVYFFFLSIHWASAWSGVSFLIVPENVVRDIENIHKKIWQEIESVHSIRKKGIAFTCKLGI